MPEGPKGEKRPTHVIGAAIVVARIATGEIEHTRPAKFRIRQRAESKAAAFEHIICSLKPERRLP
jgi:hypothetical protein